MLGERIDLILPVVILVLAFFAGVIQVYCKNYASALYWFSASSITLSVILLGENS